MYKCEYCGKEYPENKGRSFGAHKVSCSENPKRKETFKKIKDSNFLGYSHFSCKKCGGDFRVRNSKINSNGKPIYCSVSCSNSDREIKEEQRTKTSKSMKNFYRDKRLPEFVSLICQNETCKKEFTVIYKKKEQKYCSKGCQYRCVSFREKLKGSKNSGKNNPMYGKSPGNSKGVYVDTKKHTGEDRFYVRSTYEAEYVKVLESDQSVICYTYEPKEYRSYYKYNGINRSYLPDFLVQTKNSLSIIEVKPKRIRSLPEIEAKKESFIRSFPNITYIYWSPDNK